MRTVLLLLAAAAFATPNPVHWEAHGPAKPVKVGARFTVSIVARINPGWHLYAMKQSPDGPRPARLWVSEGQPFESAGPLKVPEPETVLDPNFNTEVRFYQGEAGFELPVKAAERTAGPGKIALAVSYQACNDQMCLPPRTLKIEIPVEIRK